jgi:hypothetical protein
LTSFLYVYLEECWTREHQKMFKSLGMPYDIEAQKVSILSSIVDQSHSIIKKVRLQSIMLPGWFQKKFVTICLSIFSTGTWVTNQFDTNGTKQITVTFRIWIKSKRGR